MRLANVDFSRESFPYFLYKKIGFVYDQMTITFPLDYGFHYMIERINARWSSQNPAVPGFAFPVQIEFFKNGGALALQLHPVDFQLMTSPAESGVAVDTLPGANPAYPFTARPLNVTKKLDSLLRFRDVINIRFTNVTAITVPGDPNGSIPSYLELMIIGRNYPAYKQVGWSN